MLQEASSSSHFQLLVEDSKKHVTYALIAKIYSDGICGLSDLYIEKECNDSMIMASVIRLIIPISKQVPRSTTAAGIV